MDDLFLVAGPSLSADQDLHLTAVPTALEVRDTVFSMTLQVVMGSQLLSTFFLERPTNHPPPPPPTRG